MVCLRTAYSESDNPELMIRGIPTLLIFKNGQLADQIVGLVPKEEITKKLDQQL